MAILITGGTGFIGSHTVVQLLNDGMLTSAAADYHQFHVSFLFLTISPETCSAAAGSKIHSASSITSF